MKRKTKQKPISDREIEVLLARFIRQDLTIEEAEQAILRLQTARPRALVSVLAALRSLVYHTEPEPAEPISQPPAHDPLDSLLILLGLLGDSDIIDSLRPILDDPAVQDDLKLKLISVIHQFDADADVDALMECLQNPREAFLNSQREHLERLQAPSEIAAWLELMQEQMSPDMRIAFIEMTTQIGSQSIVPLLICMSYDPDDGVVLAALDAIERFKDARALPALDEIARHHPSKAVRTEARKTVERLHVRAALAPQIASNPQPPLHACYLSTIDGAGGQLAFVVRALPDDLLAMVDVMFNDVEGIKQCVGAEIDSDELHEMLFALGDRSITSVPVTHAQCLTALQKACEATWRAGRPLPMSYVAWRDFVEGEKPATEGAWPTLSVPTRKRPKLLRQCHELLLQEEFEFWFLNPDEIGDLIAQYRAQGIARDALPALRSFLQQGVRDLITDSQRSLIRDRLLRVAPLLKAIYVDDDVWQWAVVAAEALGEDASLPLDQHPLLLGVIALSLENALGESIAWLDAV